MDVGVRVVGARHVGLAIGSRLAEQDRSFRVLDAADRPAAAQIAQAAVKRSGWRAKAPTHVRLQKK
jgi:hypothetical protein